MSIRRVAQVVGRSVATTSCALAKLGLCSLKAIDPTELVVSYKHEVLDRLLHRDMKKLGCIALPGHRISGDPRGQTRGVGREVAHLAIDEHLRVGFVQMYRNKLRSSAVAFLEAALAHYKALSVTIKRLIADNCAAYRSKLFGRTCLALGSTHSHAPISQKPMERQ